MRISSRSLYVAIAAAGFGLPAVGLVYFQKVLYLLPCPMCVMQRIAFLLAGALALAAALHNPGRTGRRFYGGLIGLSALGGLGVALRQLYLIHFPPPFSFECGVSPEEKLLNALPLAKWWPGMFQAIGDCTEVAWTFLSVSIPGWAAICFAAILAAALWTASRKN